MTTTTHTTRRRRHLLLMLGCLLGPLVAQAADGTDPLASSLSVGVGLAAGPAYEGASTYSATPLPLLKAVAPTGAWGTFTAAFPEGLRWDLPLGDVYGIALLGNYDAGRKESIRTLSGHDHHLRGMGDLGGTPVAGVELSMNYAPYRFFLRGMQALRERHYGGEDLGRTAYADLGVSSSVPLADDLRMDIASYVTWSDRHDMMARFGVTPEQARRTGFSAHSPDAGLRGVTVVWGLGWQWTPEVSLEGGVRLNTLTATGHTTNPMTEKTTSATVFMNALYTF